MMTVSAVDEAEASRAGCAPTRACGATGSTGKPSPSSVTRPPSIPHSGRTDVTRPKVSAFVVQLDVPVEVVAPRVGSIAQPDGDADRGRLVGTLRDANEVHAGLLGSAPALAAGGGGAAGKQGFPAFSCAPGGRPRPE